MLAIVVAVLLKLSFCTPIQSASPPKEACEPGYYLDFSSSSCVPCDRACFSCSQHRENCTHCPAFSHQLIKAGTVLTCECDFGFYRDSDSNCAQCSSGCLTCEHFDRFCTSCRFPMVLSRAHTCDRATPKFKEASFRRLQEADWSLPAYYETVRTVSIGPVLYVTSRELSHTSLSAFDTASSTWSCLSNLNAFTDSEGWNLREHYSTIRLNAVGRTLYLLGRSGNGVVLFSYNVDEHRWNTLPGYQALLSSDGWSDPSQYETIRTVTISTNIYLVARGADELVLCYFDTGLSEWSEVVPRYAWLTNADSWNLQVKYTTIRAINVGNKLYLFARDSVGLHLRSFDPATTLWTELQSYPQYTDADVNSLNYVETLLLTSVGARIYVSGLGPATTRLYSYDCSFDTWYTHPGSSLFSDPIWTLKKWYVSLQFFPIGNTLFLVGRGLSIATYSVISNSWSYLSAITWLSDDGVNSLATATTVNAFVVNQDFYLIGRTGSYIYIMNCATNSGAMTELQSLSFQCHQSCNECIQRDADSCTHCYDFASLLQLAPPSSCVCNPGYLPMPDSSNCQFLCHPSCKSCSGTQQTDCTQCYDHSVLVSGPPSACKCEPGSYATTNGRCVACDNRCSDCVGPKSSDCLKCKGNMMMLATAPSVCICPAGYFLDSPSAGLCQKCYSLCLKCVSGYKSGCEDCRGQTRLIGVAPNACACPDTYFISNIEDGICALCHFACLHCVGPKDSDCIACGNNAKLKESSPSACVCADFFYWEPKTNSCTKCSNYSNSIDSSVSSCTQCENSPENDAKSCVCQPGFYPDLINLQCVSCDSACVTCRDKYQCQMCWPHAYLDSSQACMCEDGYYGSAEQCQECQFGCKQCFTNARCDFCKDYFVLLKDQCVKSETLKATLTANEKNALTLDFSIRLKNRIRSSDFSLEIYDLDGREYPFSSVLREVSANKTYLISLAIDPNSFPNTTQVSLTFSNPQEVLSFLNFPLNTYQLSVPLASSQVLQNATKPYAPKRKPQEIAIVSASALTSLVAALVSGNPNSLFTLINNVQLLTYLPLSRAPLPPRLKSQLVSLNIQSFIVNPFEFVFDVANTLPPGFAVDYGFESYLLLMNVGVMATFGLALAGLYPILAAVEKSGVRVAAEYAGKLRKQFRWNFVMEYWIECYLDFCIAAFLQVYVVFDGEMDWKSASAVSNAILSFAIAVMCGVSPVFFTVLTYKCRQATQMRDFSRISQWKSLYSEFRTEAGFSIALFYPFFLFRRLLFASTLVFLCDFSLTQSVISIIHSAFVLHIQTVFYLFKCQPYESRLNSIISILSELPIALTFTLSTAFHFIAKDDLYTLTDYTCVVLAQIAVSAPTLAAIAEIVGGVKTVAQRLKQARYVVRVAFEQTEAVTVWSQRSLEITSESVHRQTPDR